MTGVMRLPKPLLAVAAAFLSVSLAAGASTDTWQIEMVDQSGSGKHSSLKIDHDGNVHIAYIIDDHTLKYAFWDHANKRWFTMGVAAGTSFCDLALDSKQRPHISYADFGTGIGAKLHHVYWDGTVWQNQAVPLNSEVIAYYTSIALDANDYPAISFYEYRGPAGTEISVRMRIVTWNGKYWEVQTIDGDNQSGKFNSIAIDSQGHRHLAYGNVSAMIGGARYAFWDGQTTKLEIVDDRSMNETDLVGYSIAMALDKDGNPHLTYANISHLAVKYAVRKAGRWSVQTVDGMRGVAYPDRNSIAIDPGGQPYIGYYDSGLGALKVAHRDRNKWMVETVDNTSSGFTSSMQIDRGVLWISYADEANGGLKVARREIGPSDAGAVDTAKRSVKP